MPDTTKDPTIVAFGPVYIGTDGRKIRRAHWDGYFSPFDARIEGGMWIEIDTSGLGRLFLIASTVRPGAIVDTHLRFYTSGEPMSISHRPGWSYSHFAIPHGPPPSPPPPPPVGGIAVGRIAHMHNMPPWSSTPTPEASRVDPDPSNAADIVVPLAGTLEFETLPRVFSSRELQEGPVTRASGVQRDVLFYKRFEFRFPTDKFYQIAVVARGFEVF